MEDLFRMIKKLDELCKNGADQFKDVYESINDDFKFLKILQHEDKVFMNNILSWMIDSE